MAKRSSRLASILVTLVLLIPLLIAALPGDARAHHVPFVTGDVFVGVGFGQIKHFAPDGTLLEVLDTTTGSFVDTGMCFDAAGNLYSTNFGANSVSKFDTNGLLLDAEYLTGFDASPESCRFDAAGNLYVGQADGTHNLLKFDPAGTPLATFSPAIENRGTDWIDLAPDQCTMLYTSSGASVKRFDVCTNTQLSDFCGPCGPNQPPFRTFGLFSPRLLSDTSLLVVDQETAEVRRFDSSGIQIQSYPVPIPDTYLVPPPGDGTPAAPFALALDPDGTSFWTADVNTGQVFRFDLASGALLTQFNAEVLLDLEGLAVFGEPTAATQGQAITVTASITAADKPYDTTTAATITSCTLSGVVGTDDVSCTASGGAFATASVGNGKTVSATVSLTGTAAGNYVLSSTTATTTANITPAPASVTPNAASKTYGTADPAFTGTLTGFFAADGITASYSRTAGETVAGSPYTISATLSPAGALGNYAITYNTASFTITKAAASVAPNPASKTYGAADPAFTGTLTGFLAADNVTATYSRTAGETVAGSPYTISATLSPAGVLGNYTITYDTAAFTITRATPLVTWANPADITYPTPLSGTQLNATANVPGAFAYTPPAGTVLSPGNNQLLSVLFTPTDNSDYTTASAQVHINVLPASAQCAALPCQIPAKNPANVVTVTSCSAPAVTTFGNWTQINMPTADVVLKCALTQLPGTSGARIIARSIKIDGTDAAHQGSITTSGVLGIQLTASAPTCSDATVEILSATLTDNNSNGDVTISACGDVVVRSSSITSAGQVVSVTTTSGRICAESNAFFGNDVSLQAQGDLVLRNSSVRTVGPRDNIKLVSTAGSVLAGGAGPAPCLPNEFKGENESNMTVTASGIIDQTGACVDIAETITLTASGTGRNCASDTIIGLAGAELRNDFGKTGSIKVSACSDAGRIDIANAILVDAGAKGGGTDPNAVSSLNGGKLTTATCSAISPNPPNASCSSRPVDLGNHPMCADQTDRALRHVVGQPKVDR